MKKKLAIALGVGVALYVVVLLVLGPIVAGKVAIGIETRLGESLQAGAHVGDSELALLRGHLDLAHLQLRRDDAVGTLALDVDDVRCELAPLGWALVDHDCREIVVRGVRMEVSTAALFHVKNPRHAPVHTDHVVIDDATLTFSPSAFVPGLGKMTIAIEHADAGPTVFRSPLSWLLSLRELRARFELGAGIVLHVTYEAGVMSVAGSLFGSAPVAVPVTLPVAAAAATAQEELQLLVQTAKDVAETLVAKRAEDWLRAKLR